MSQIDRRINNIEAQIAGLYGSTGVQSVVAGTNVTITGTTSNPIINSTGSSGVSSIVAGTGISVSGTTTVTVANTGITALVAGTGISVSGSTINNTGITALVAGTGISVSGSTINNTGITALVAGTGISVSGSTINNTGVLSVSAGTNTTITGTATNPIINVTSSPSTTTNPIDIAGVALYTVNPSQLNNSQIFSTLTLPPTGTFIDLPSYSQLVSAYGSSAVISFTIGNLNQNMPAPDQPVYLTVQADPSFCWVTQSVSAPLGGWTTPAPTVLFTQPNSAVLLTRKSYMKCTAILDFNQATVNYCLTWLAGVA